MELAELKVGDLYIQPCNNKSRFIWSNLKLRPDSVLLGTLKPLDAFVLLEIYQTDSEFYDKIFNTKILTTNGIIGWVEWQYSVYQNKNSFELFDPTAAGLFCNHFER